MISFKVKLLCLTYRKTGKDTSRTCIKINLQVELSLLEKYADSGIYEIEDIDILKLDPFVRFGKPAKIAQLFGGREGYLQAVRELEQAIYTKEAV